MTLAGPLTERPDHLAALRWRRYWGDGCHHPTALKEGPELTYRDAAPAGRRGNGTLRHGSGRLWMPGDSAARSEYQCTDGTRVDRCCASVSFRFSLFSASTSRRRRSTNSRGSSRAVFRGGAGAAACLHVRKPLTGINALGGELQAKRLELLRELVPKAARVALLVNPANPRNAETTVRDVEVAARAMGLQIQVLNASTSREIA